MKVRTVRSTPARWGRQTAAAAVVLTLAIAVPAPAIAITRDDVVARASDWVGKRVPYSQRGYFAGYRRDCSGMVSMAWALGRSYTSRTIESQAWRIPISDLRPGDAVRTPGHVALFAGWVDPARGTYVALEQSRASIGAVCRVRKLGRRPVALRYRGIEERTAVAVSTARPSTGDTTSTVAAVLR